MKKSSKLTKIDTVLDFWYLNLLGPFLKTLLQLDSPRNWRGFNPFLSNDPILYTLKRPRRLLFSGVFSVFKIVTLAASDLIGKLFLFLDFRHPNIFRDRLRIFFQILSKFKWILFPLMTFSNDFRGNRIKFAKQKEAKSGDHL